MAFHQIFHQMVMRLNLCREISPEGRNDYIRMYLFQYLKNIVLLQVISEKLLVVGKTSVGIISAVGVKIRAEFLVYGVSHKSTRSQYQYLLFLQTRLRGFIKWQFYDGGRNFVDAYLNVNGVVQFGIFGGHITQTNPFG